MASPFKLGVHKYAGAKLAWGEFLARIKAERRDGNYGDSVLWLLRSVTHLFKF
jgi:hypothetical protein